MFFGKQSGKAELQTPPPTPPLEGRGAATALFAAWDSADTLVEGTTHYTHFAEKIRPQKPRRGDRIQAGVKQSETPAKACAAKALKGRRNTGRGKTPAKCCQHTTSPRPVTMRLVPLCWQACRAGVSPLLVFLRPFGAVMPTRVHGFHPCLYSVTPSGFLQ